MKAVIDIKVEKAAQMTFCIRHYGITNVIMFLIPKTANKYTVDTNGWCKRASWYRLYMTFVICLQRYKQSIYICACLMWRMFSV